MAKKEKKLINELQWMLIRQKFVQNKKRLMSQVMRFEARKTKAKTYIKPMIISQIMYRYFSLMMQGVMDGLKVNFPGFGTIYVVKEKMTKPKVWKAARFIIKNPHEHHVYNPRRPNLNYRIIIDAPILALNEMRAFATDKWRKTLNRILTTTDKDYIMYQNEH